MDNRYDFPPISRLFTQPATYDQWAVVERHVAIAQSEMGVIPHDAGQAILQTPTPDATDVARIEAATHHDVGAFVAAMRELVPVEHRRWLHHGMTSSDLVDTAAAITHSHVANILAMTARNTAGALLKLSDRSIGVYRAARTHGQLADPTTFGLQVLRHRETLLRAYQALLPTPLPMKLSGPTGTYAYNPPAVEIAVARSLSLPFDPYASQVVGRDSYTRYAFNLNALVAACEQFAMEVRIGSQSGIDELAEDFGETQIGSTAMPHKRNPIKSERICGLARVARGYLMTVTESGSALWGERDISNSSVERVALRDLTVLTGYVLAETAQVATQLGVNEAAMDANLGQLGLPTPAATLWTAIRAGSQHDVAYRAVQRGHGGIVESVPDELRRPAWYLRNHPAVAIESSPEVD